MLETFEIIIITIKVLLSEFVDSNINLQCLFHLRYAILTCILDSKTHFCKLYLHTIPNMLQIMWNYMKNHQYNSCIMFFGKEM